MRYYSNINVILMGIVLSLADPSINDDNKPKEERSPKDKGIIFNVPFLLLTVIVMYEML